MKKEKVSIFWFRRDLRLEDNRGLHESLKNPYPLLPIFIFDTNISDELAIDDPRITFIHDLLNDLSSSLNAWSAGIYCKKGQPEHIWQQLLNEFDVQAVYANEDYEPYAIQRDKRIRSLLSEKSIPLYLFKDQVVFAKDEVLKKDQTPYTVFTPYKNKWIQQLNEAALLTYPLTMQGNFLRKRHEIPELSDLGFKRSTITVRPYTLAFLEKYAEIRDFPALDQTTQLGPHLRFGSVSIRKIVMAARSSQTFLSELIWREFFMQILYHFPKVVSRNFKAKYDRIMWRNNSEEFEKWKNGETGYPLVDAGMHELNSTGYMHNRVRMIVASFLCKHLLIDWRWGEAYFAEKLLDYELSSNNGNWQWAAGTGCDAAPYFRVFNPVVQAEKFDPQKRYIKKWLPDIEIANYHPMVEHKHARERAIQIYKQGLIYSNRK
jgi:deoxyribodipyrimidine photo-lyase